MSAQYTAFRHKLAPNISWIHALSILPSSIRVIPNFRKSHHPKGLTSSGSICFGLRPHGGLQDAQKKDPAVPDWLESPAGKFVPIWALTICMWRDVCFISFCMGPYPLHVTVLFHCVTTVVRHDHAHRMTWPYPRYNFCSFFYKAQANLPRSFWVSLLRSKENQSEDKQAQGIADLCVWVIHIRCLNSYLINGGHLKPDEVDWVF